VEEVVDGRTELGRLRRAAARGERDSDRGAVGVDLARAEEQEERVGRLLVKGIGMGWCGEGELQREAAAVVRCCVGKNTEQKNSNSKTQSLPHYKMNFESR
jgi:hypothetical protein